MCNKIPYHGSSEIMTKTVSINYIPAMAPLDDLCDFQEDLKDLSEDSYKSLKNQILENGFLVSFSVWADETGKLNLLDGHQRVKTLKRMRDEGIELPSEFPIGMIEAETKIQAKKILLSLVSQYGTLNEKGLHKFLVKSKLNVADLPKFRLPTKILSVPDFRAKYFANAEAEPARVALQSASNALNNPVNNISDDSEIDADSLQPKSDIPLTEDEKRLAFDNTKETNDNKNKRFVIILDCPTSESKEALKTRLGDGFLKEYGAKIF